MQPPSTPGTAARNASCARGSYPTTFAPFFSKASAK